MEVAFFNAKTDAGLGVVDAPSVPRQHEFISIRGVAWRVVRVTWALDNSDAPMPERRLRANVELCPGAE